MVDLEKFAIAGGSNSSFISIMSTSSPFPLVIIDTETHGRGFTASRNIKEDEVVLMCAPLAAVPTDDRRLEVCCGCFQPCTSVCACCNAVALCEKCSRAETRPFILHQVLK